MLQKVLSRILVLVFVFGFSMQADAQRKRRKSKKNTKEIVKPASKPKPKPKKGGIQPYAKVVTKEHKTDAGLFNVHTKDEKHLFEIPD